MRLMQIPVERKSAAEAGQSHFRPEVAMGERNLGVSSRASRFRICVHALFVRLDVRFRTHARRCSVSLGARSCRLSLSALKLRLSLSALEGRLGFGLRAL